jgi:hypothetical protein
VTAPAEHRRLTGWLTGWLAGEGPAARSRTAVAALAALAALGAGAGAGWLAARGWPAVRGAPDAGGDVALLAAMAVVLAAGNGYAKAYSP